MTASDGHRQKRAVRICCTAFALVFAALLGFAAGRFTDIGQSFFQRYDTVTFSEPLLEQAVRLRLGKSDDDPVTEEELQTVTELYVFGSRAAADNETYIAYSEEFSGGNTGVLRGSIVSLEDVARMKNLRRLSLAYQNIRDLTPLEQLSYLEHVELKHNPISDVSPLSRLTSLTALFLYDTSVSDLTCLSGCTRLNTLDVGYTQITSMTAFDGLGFLETLILDRTRLCDLENIGSHLMLEQLSIAETPLLDLTPLLGLRRLQTVTVSEDMRQVAQAIAMDARFEIEYR